MNFFGVDYDHIDVLVHPQSVIHSMVQFKDKAVIAQLGAPDMKLPDTVSFYISKRESQILYLKTLDFMKNVYSYI